MANRLEGQRKHRCTTMLFRQGNPSQRICAQEIVVSAPCFRGHSKERATSRSPLNFPKGYNMYQVVRRERRPVHNLQPSSPPRFHLLRLGSGAQTEQLRTWWNKRPCARTWIGGRAYFTELVGGIVFDEEADRAHPAPMPAVAET